MADLVLFLISFWGNEIRRWSETWQVKKIIKIWSKQRPRPVFEEIQYVNVLCTVKLRIPSWWWLNAPSAMYSVMLFKICRSNFIYKGLVCIIRTTKCLASPTTLGLHCKIFHHINMLVKLISTYLVTSLMLNWWFTTLHKSTMAHPLFLFPPTPSEMLQSIKVWAELSSIRRTWFSTLIPAAESCIGGFIVWLCSSLHTQRQPTDWEQNKNTDSLFEGEKR